MFVAAVSGALINLVRGLTVMRLKNHIRIVAEPALWMKLLSLPAAFFRRYQIGDLAQRMQGISSLSVQLSSAVVSGIFNGLFCFWNLLVMLHFSYQLTFLAAFIWCVFLFISLLLSWWQVKCKREQTEAAGKVSGALLQILAGLNKFRLRIRELPMGMHTMIGEGGSTFSGGQRQRLLIARAIAQRPRLIIFDEATSSLDNETQAIVANTLANMHCTRIVVAHRLSTIKNADKIVVLDRGEIIEEGTYGELLKKQGAFSRLAARQLE